MKSPNSQLPPSSLRSLILCGANGQIRCAGTLASGWLEKYFPKTDIAEELPAAIRQWLLNKKEGSQSLRMARNRSSLVITLVHSESGGPHCLFLEETAAKSQPSAQLTRREREVLSWVAQGKANWAIAKILNVSPGTIRKHLQHIYSKLGVENRTAAALCTVEILPTNADGIC